MKKRIAGICLACLTMAALAFGGCAGEDEAKDKVADLEFTVVSEAGSPRS